MPYVTLLEASQIVHHETGIDITVPQLIRAGAMQNLPLCVLLDVKCYSPTHRIKREKKSEELDPDYWRNCPVDSINDADVVNAYGLFVLPPRHVFAYQTKETVKIQSVVSLDGQDIYFPFVDVSRDQIQITLRHLTAFMAHIKAARTDTQPHATIRSPAPVATTKRSEKKPSIETVAFDYMRAEFKQGQFQSAAKFHKHLIKTAGLDKSPFEMGTGINARKLFCPAASSFFDEGTLGKIWAKIRAV